MCHQGRNYNLFETSAKPRGEYKLCSANVHAQVQSELFLGKVEQTEHDPGGYWARLEEPVHITLLLHSMVNSNK